jgi:hypothetical protein
MTLLMLLVLLGTGDPPPSAVLRPFSGTWYCTAHWVPSLERFRIDGNPDLTPWFQGWGCDWEQPAPRLRSTLSLERTGPGTGTVTGLRFHLDDRRGNPVLMYRLEPAGPDCLRVECWRWSGTSGPPARPEWVAAFVRRVPGTEVPGTEVPGTEVPEVVARPVRKSLPGQMDPSPVLAAVPVPAPEGP